MAKIIVGKNDDAGTVIKKIENSESRKMILVIPRQSKFGEEVSNFGILREAATELDKEIAIESVDENTLALARANGFEALHPLFEGSARGNVSDILPAKRSGKIPASAKAAKKKEPVMLHRAEELLEETLENLPPEDVSAETSELKPSSRRKFPSKKILYFIGAVAALAAIFFAGTSIFARADVTLRFKKTPWQDTASFTAAADPSSPGILKAQIFNPVKSATPLFPATGKSQVSEKARGKILIFNAYSSKSQQLVATTRFETPDGKILRLVSQVTVPGAKIQDGKIIPSSIEADVIADKPGAEYNVGPMEKLTIPGFKGSARYDGFYGKLEAQLKGGFIGVRQVPTATDVETAKTKTTELLRAAFGPGFLDTVSDGLKILDGSSSFEVIKLSVDTATDKDGNFSVLGQARYTAIGFSEEELKTALLARAKKQDPNASFEEISVKYSNVRPDFKRGAVSFTVASDAVLAPSFDRDAFRGSILGKQVGEVRDAILRLPELSEGKISLSPVWLSAVPTSANRVKILVE